jgi:hypothetical protein
LTVFAGIQRKDLAVLVRPDDTVVPDVQSFQHMLIASVKTPPAGVWHLELDGAGTYAVTAHVQPSDGGPHFGTFKPSSCEAAFANAKGVELLLVARDGSIIATSQIGECKIPDVPYRAAIRGVDSTGAAFQRIESGLRTQEKK